MSDLEFGVRIRADASGLVGQLGQAEEGVKRVGQATAEAGRAAGQLGNASGRMAAGARQAATALDQEGRAAGELERILTRLENTYDKTGAPMRRYMKDLADISRLQKAGAIDAEHAAMFTQRAAETYQTAGRGVTRSAGEVRMGTMMLGQQIQDVGMQLALGTDAMRVFAMQAGQAGLALQQMGAGGVAGRVANFLGSVWGSAVLAAVSVVGVFIMNMRDAKEAMEAAETGADALAQAQSVLGQIFDLTSGKIERQNGLLIANARLTAINLRAEAMQARTSANQTFGRATSSRGGVVGQFLDWADGGIMTSDWGRQNLGPHVERIRRARSPEERAQAIDRALRETELRPGADPNTDPLANLTNVTGTQWRQALIDIARAEQNENVADLIDQSLNSGSLHPDLRRPGRGGRPRRERDGTAARQRLEEFGQDAAVRIRELAAGFQDNPAQVERVTRAIADLDDLLEDVEQRRPPNFEQLLAQGREARQVIEDGLTKPFRDFIRQQQEGLEVAQLVTQGREAEAEALQIILQLERQMPPLNEAQKAAVLATVEARRAEARQLEINRERQQKYLDALSQAREILTGLTTDLLGGELGSLLDLPGQLLKTFNQLTARSIMERMFGDAFRELQDQVTGAGVVEDASTRMADAVDAATRSIARLGDAAEAAATGVASTGQQEEAEQAIVVTGRRHRDPADFFEDMISRLAEGLLGRQMAETIGRLVSRGLQGAMYGTMAGGVLRSLGINTSRTGSAIGGAIGNIAGEALKGSITSVFGQAIGSAAGPIGSVIGGLLGGLVGGLFGPKPKYGSASISDTTSGPRTSGNDRELNAQASSLAGAVQQGIQQIADTLGASVGAFNVSIGTYKGTYRINRSGGKTNGKNTGHINYGEDPQAAINAAIADAIADGAIKGLSAAVQKALRSSDDVNKALREAVKVDELETLLKGFSGQVEKAFRQFDTQAAERVRIAKQYGFDLVKLEEVNAKERAKLFEDILGSRIGQLQDLLKDLTVGDLFEGSLVEQRAKILEELAKAKTDAEAGVDGAADRVAELTRQLIEISREAFGTAGEEYAADRADAISTAEKIIKLERDRVEAAINRGNELTNETNNLLAETNALLRGMGGGGGGGTTGSRLHQDISTLRRVDL